MTQEQVYTWKEGLVLQDDLRFEDLEDPGQSFGKIELAI